jgi:hypothetical protein
VPIDDMTNSLWQGLEHLTPVAEPLAVVTRPGRLGAGHMPLMVVRAAISYHRPGCKARQGQGPRAAGNCTPRELMCASSG